MDSAKAASGASTTAPFGPPPGVFERRDGVLMHRDPAYLRPILENLLWKAGPPLGLSTFGLLTGFWWPAYVVVTLQTLDAVADWVPRFRKKLRRFRTRGPIGREFDVKA